MLHLVLKSSSSLSICDDTNSNADFYQRVWNMKEDNWAHDQSQFQIRQLTSGMLMINCMKKKCHLSISLESYKADLLLAAAIFVNWT